MAHEKDDTLANDGVDFFFDSRDGAVIMLGFLDHTDGFDLSQVTLGHPSAQSFFQKVGEDVDAAMLRPKILHFVGTAHTKWDQVINLEFLPVHLTDMILEADVVSMDDRAFEGRGDRAVTVLDVFRVAIGVGVLTKGSCRRVVFGDGRETGAG